MSQRVEPALTPEEWADDGKPVVLGSWDDAYVDVRAGLVDDPDDDANAGRAPHPRFAHAVAALVLRGQPFGFTWEMVDALRMVTPAEPETWHDAYAYRHELRAAVERVAALLPPRDGAATTDEGTPQ